jgi:general secretion pathway protein N
MIKKIRLRHPLLLLLFCGSYLLFLLASMPAAQIVPRLPLPAGLQLHNIKGSLWQGSIGDIRWQKQRLHNLQWEVLFSRLWLAMPTIKLSLQDPDTAIISGLVGWRGHWSLSDWQIKTSADTLQQWIAIPLPINASGAFTLNIDQWTFNAAECQTLTGQLNWQQAQLKMPAGELALGNPHATLSCKNKVFEAKVQQDASDLQSNIDLQLTMQGGYKLQASLHPKPALSDNLRSSISWLGTADNSGVIRIKSEGVLP